MSRRNLSPSLCVRLLVVAAFGVVGAYRQGAIGPLIFACGLALLFLIVCARLDSESGRAAATDRLTPPQRYRVGVVAALFLAPETRRRRMVPVGGLRLHPEFGMVDRPHREVDHRRASVRALEDPAERHLTLLNRALWAEVTDGDAGFDLGGPRSNIVCVTPLAHADFDRLVLGRDVWIGSLRDLETGPAIPAADATTTTTAAAALESADGEGKETKRDDAGDAENGGDGSSRAWACIRMTKLRVPCGEMNLVRPGTFAAMSGGRAGEHARVRRGGRPDGVVVGDAMCCLLAPATAELYGLTDADRCASLDRVAASPHVVGQVPTRRLLSFSSLPSPASIARGSRLEDAKMATATSATPAPKKDRKAKRAARDARRSARRSVAEPDGAPSLEPRVGADNEKKIKVHEWFALHDRVAVLRASRYYARTLVPFVTSTMRLSAPSAQHCSNWPGTRHVGHPDERDVRASDAVTAAAADDASDTGKSARMAARSFEFALAYQGDAPVAELWFHRGREWTASLGTWLVPQHLHTLVFDLSRDYWHQLAVDVGGFACFAFLRRFSYRDAQYMHSTARSRIAHALAGFAASLETLELECRSFAHELLTCEFPMLVALRLARTLVALPQRSSAPSLERLLARSCPQLRTLTLDSCLSPLPTSSEAPLCSVESVHGHAQHALHFHDWSGIRLPSSTTLTELDCTIDDGDGVDQTVRAWPQLTALTVRDSAIDSKLIASAPSLAHIRCVPTLVTDAVRANLTDAVGDDGHGWRNPAVGRHAVMKSYRVLCGR